MLRSLSHADAMLDNAKLFISARHLILLRQVLVLAKPQLRGLRWAGLVRTAIGRRNARRRKHHIFHEYLLEGLVLRMCLVQRQTLF